MNWVVKVLVQVLAGLTVLLSLFGAGTVAAAAQTVASSPPPANAGIVPDKAVDPVVKARVQEAYGKLPLSFIANDGQLDRKVKYYEQGSGRSTFFTDDAVYLSLPAKKPGSAGAPARTAELIKLRPVGASKAMKLAAEERQPGSVNYFIGKDPAKWKSDVATYKAVVYREAYQGIDLRFYGNNSQFEYDVVVQPGADPAKVTLAYEGIRGLKLTADGDLEIRLDAGSIVQKKPYIYQEIDGKRVTVDGRFRIPATQRSKRGSAPFSYGFEVAAYDRKHALVIDPVIVYSTYLGGSADEFTTAITVDAAGNSYIAGQTYSLDFPVSSSLNSSRRYGAQFVTKLNTSGDALVFSTLLGGSGNDDLGSGDYISTIAVDPSGNVYVAGTTYSSDFPLVSPLYSTRNGAEDAFVLRLNPSGSAIAYSTYLGGIGYEAPTRIAVDASGNAYVSGVVYCSGFPTVSALFGTFNGVPLNGVPVTDCAYDPTDPAHWVEGADPFGLQDGFLTKINPSGSALVYSTYFGGNLPGIIQADAAGNAYVSATISAENRMMKIDPTGGLASSTVLPPGNVALDASGNVKDVYNAQFIPVAPGSPTQDFCVSRFNYAANALAFTTCLGVHTGRGELGGFAVDAAGNAYFAGSTWSSGFPTVAALYGPSGTVPDHPDAFVVKINYSGSVAYSTYLGGNDSEYVAGIAVDAAGNAYVAGRTYSKDFPTVAPLYPTNSFGSTTRLVYDAFVTRLSDPAGNTPTGSNVVVSPIPSATLAFTQITSPGQTTVTQSGTGTPPPTGFMLGAPPSYYEIHTTAGYSGPIAICLVYDEASFSGNESSLKLLHRKTGSNNWDDVTTSLNTTTNTICGTVTSFSEFVIAIADTVPPLSSLSASPAANASGWNNSPVAVTLAATDNAGGSGVKELHYSFGANPEVTVAGGTTSFTVADDGIFGIAYYAKDKAGNVEAPAKNFVVKIDRAAPGIVVNSPANGAEYLLGQAVAADWSANDPLSGIAAASGTLPSGSAIDTAAVGTRTFSVSAIDNAGNAATSSVSYSVRYNFGGFAKPVNADGSSLFKLGRTVPVKFSLTRADGSFVTTAVANILIAKISDNVVGTEEQAVATDAATSGNLFRYDSDGNQYVFNLSTSELSVGTYQIRATLDDGSSKTVLISLR